MATPSVAHVLRVITARMKERCAISDEDMNSLSFLFDEGHVRAALDIVDGRKIRKYIAQPSGRSCHVTQGRKEYLTFEAYCTCPSNTYDTVVRNEKVMCKHSLALAIATAVNGSEVTEVTDRELAELIMSKLSTET